jgi:hypothetical protein
MELFCKHPDVSQHIGKRFHAANTEWECVGHNDLNVPYFSKVIGGKVQKTQYTVPGLHEALWGNQ